MNNGHIGRVIEVDLSMKQVNAVDLEGKAVRDFLGGLGLGIKTLYDEVGPNVDALSPDNVVMIATGPLSGTSAPTNGRTQVVTKSPLTGILGTGNFGGFWGPRLRRAGFEAVVIRGKSNSPVYLWIEDGTAELRSAEHLWGKDCWETTDILREELGEDVSVLSIGPAGENLVRFACPIIDYYHAPGRSHAGCVMGSKKIKAIAVRGTREVAIFDPEGFKEAVREATSRIVNYPERQKKKKGKVGSYLNMKNLVTAGIISSRNFQTTIMPPDYDLCRVPESVVDHLTTTGKFCYHCPMGFGCDLIAEVKTGPYAGVRVGGINCYISYWPGYLGIKSLPAAWQYKVLCQRYGMDQGGPIPFVEELFQKGILKKEDCDGLELSWGNETAIMELLRKIAYREGIGNILAEGSVRAAKTIGKGAEGSVMTIKGLEIFGKDPRMASKMNALGTVTSPRGGDEQLTTGAFPFGFPRWAGEAGWSKDEYLRWLISYVDMFDDVKAAVFGANPTVDILDSENLQGKAALTKWLTDFTAVANSLGLCLISENFWPTMGPTNYAKLYSACTGWQTSPQELIKAGERISNLMRAYIVREGIRRKDDDWPARFYCEPIPDGPKKGALLSRDKINSLLEQYYDMRGWNRETGVPTKEKLVELDLDYVADELSKKGVIAD